MHVGPPVLSLGVQRYILDSCLPQWVFQSPILSPPLRATAKGAAVGRLQLSFWEMPGT